jgi:outer membrane receptor protein involved in Fe transport
MSQKVTLSTLLISLLFASETSLAESTDTKSNSTTLNEIVVSAELLNKSLNESAQSVEVFTEETLENQAGLNTTRDIYDTTSNVSFMEGTGTAPTIRGVDGTGPSQNAIAIFAGGRPRLNVEIDGRPVSFNELVYGDFSLFDVEKVEVLRGPQSTLTGRNSMAGTINIKTHDPKFEDETILRAATGSLSSNQLSAVINRPITEDTMAFRLAIDWSEKDSSVEYEAYDGVNNPELIENLDIKGKLLIEPNTENNARLLIGFTHSDYSGPSNELVSAPFEDQVSNFTTQPQHNPVTNSLVFDYSQDLSSTLQFTLNSSFTDVDFTRTTIENYNNADINTREYTLEPQLYYDHDNFSLVSGLYYYKAREEQFMEFGTSNFHYEDDTDSFGVYSEGSFNLTDDLTLSAGLRYEKETRKRYGGAYSSGVTAGDLDYDKSSSTFLPKIHLNWRQSNTLSWGAQISKGYNAGGAGYNFSTAEYYEYDDESSWTYEIYSRQQFMDGRISSTQNLFHTRYKNMQQAYSTTDDWNSDASYSIVNADEVHTWGIEQELTAILSDHLTLSGSLALLNTKVVEFDDDTSLEGNQLPTAPTLTSSISLDWQKAAWKAGLNVRFSDSYYTYLSNLNESEVNSYFVANARVSYQVGKAEWFASIDNLTDENDVIYLRGDDDSSSATSAVLQQSRTFLVGVQYKL